MSAPVFLSTAGHGLFSHRAPFLSSPRRLLILMGEVLHPSSQLLQLIAIVDPLPLRKAALLTHPMKQLLKLP